MPTLLLEILIPTYNRAKFLDKNFEILFDILQKGSFKNEVGLIISNNFSPDNTAEIISKWGSKFRNESISFLSYNQDQNIGLEPNAVFALEQATANYTMFLGDDDFLNIEYLMQILLRLKNDKNTAAIIPSVQWIDINGNKIKGGRDLNVATQKYAPGFNTCVQHFTRGQSMSGVVFYREGSVSEYLKGIRNIYPFMFFLGRCCILGNVYHETSFPVYVSNISINNKDWNYGKNGLFEDRFANSKSLFGNNSWDRFKIEKSILENNGFVLRSYFYANLNFLKFSFIGQFFKLKNATILIKLFFPIYLSKEFFKFIFNKSSLFNTSDTVKV